MARPEKAQPKIVEKEPPDALTRGQILDGEEEVNLEVARLLLAEGNAYMADLIDTKKQFETKAAVLLATIVGVATALVNAKPASDTATLMEQWPVLVIGFGFLFAGGCCVWILRGRPHGMLGTPPAGWLTPTWLYDKNPDVTARLTAVLAHDLRDAINTSIKTNASTSRLLFISLVMSLITLAVAAIAAVSGVFS